MENNMKIRIAYIVAGAGNLYCGACMRDMNLAQGITSRGHDLQMIPLYTPLRIDYGKLPTTSIFYGGINVFLQQMSGAFSFLPRWLKSAFNQPSLLRQVSKFSIQTRPEKLGPMTISVLKGQDGRQNKELEQLIDFIREYKPQIVNITNSMLSGIAPALKQHTNIPIVCTLQGEDAFVEAMAENHIIEAKELMHKNAHSIDMFTTSSHNYAQRMAKFISVPLEKITIIPSGVNIKDYPFQKTTNNSSCVIGYLSRIAPEKGLDTLLEAFKIVHAKEKNSQLYIGGQIIDKGYWQQLQKEIKRAKLEPYVRYWGELSFAAKKEFLECCDIFSVPSKFSESRGIAVLEAMATGIPVAVPDSGIYSEIVAKTKAGELFPTQDAKALASALMNLMSYSDVVGLRQKCYEGVKQHFCVEQSIEKTLELYCRLVNKE